jgi:hypothetical protein
VCLFKSYTRLGRTNYIGDPDEEMEPTNASQPTEVSRVAVRLPPFWPERQALWFAQADSQFTLAGITDERTKFHHITSQLEQRYAAEVEGIIIPPPHHEPYTKLRTEILKRMALSKQQRSHQLLTLEDMGDRKPSQFLRHLRSLAPDMPDLHMRTIWFSRLPTEIQTSLACRPELDLEAAAACADCITEVLVVSPPALTSIAQPKDNAELSSRVEELTRQVAHSALTGFHGRLPQ